MHPQMSLIRSFFWLALFLVATFCFEVLFEHGTVNFSKSAQYELGLLQKFVKEMRGEKPAPSPSPGQ